MKSYKQTSKIYYIFGLVLVALVTTFLIIAHFANIDPDELLFSMIPPCFVREYAGIYCPGCGGVRSFLYLIKGDIVNSFMYHPFLPYATVVIALFLILYTLSIMTKGKIKTPKVRPAYFSVGIGIIITQWLIKNILLLCFSVELI